MNGTIRRRQHWMIAPDRLSSSSSSSFLSCSSSTLESALSFYHDENNCNINYDNNNNSNHKRERYSLWSLAAHHLSSSQLLSSSPTATRVGPASQNNNNNSSSPSSLHRRSTSTFADRQYAHENNKQTKEQHHRGFFFSFGTNSSSSCISSGSTSAQITTSLIRKRPSFLTLLVVILLFTLIASSYQVLDNVIRLFGTLLVSPLPRSFRHSSTGAHHHNSHLSKSAQKTTPVSLRGRPREQRTDTIPSSSFTVSSSSTSTNSKIPQPQPPSKNLAGVPNTSLQSFLSSTKNKTMTTTTVSYELLKKQNAETSNALIEYFAPKSTANAAADFLRFAQYEGDLTAKRDQEDDDKLQEGIDLAKEKGVIDPAFVPQPYVEIDVLGQSPDQVADQILQQVKSQGTKDSSKGGATADSGVIVLVGLSGTGKGTTVANLRQKLQDEQGKQVVSWSNGNIFRSVTLLAATWCEQQPNGPVDIQQALTKENLAHFMSMLSFGKFGQGDDTKYDTRIHGLGLDLYVSQIQNTVLKSPKVSQNIPTVAGVTQGEVILFAAAAMQRMTMETSNLFVLLEGRAQTVDYVPTPYRFCLILSDSSLIGKRRAAQRLMAQTLKEMEESGGSSSDNKNDDDDAAVHVALHKALTTLVQEIP